jgi:hypothetical protein
MYQLLVCTEGNNLMGKNIHSTWKNTEALLVASKEDSLEVNAEKTKQMHVSHKQSAGQHRNLNIS